MSEETLLSQKRCIPCEGGVPALEDSLKDKYKNQIDSRWTFTNERKRLSLELTCEKFAQPMALANEIALLADEQWHHPDLYISFGKLRIDLWTHKIDNLVESDFIFAAKIDEVIKRHEL